MKRLHILILIALAFIVVSCAPRMNPLKVNEFYYRNPVEQVFPLVVSSVPKVPKPRNSIRGWKVVSSNPDTGIITAQAYIKRTDPRRGTTQGFARATITVEAYNETRTRITFETTPGIAETFARRVASQVRRSLPVVR